MPIVNFVREKKQIEVPAGANLRTEAIRAGINLYVGPEQYLNCRGLGGCAGCRVLVKKGMDHTSPKGVIESLSLNKTFAYIGNEAEMRLACQMQVNGDISVETQPALNLYGENFFS